MKNDEWKVKFFNPHDLEEGLNKLVSNGWHIWPQLIQQMEVNKEIAFVVITCKME